MKTKKSLKAKPPVSNEDLSVVRRVANTAALQSFSLIALHAEIMEAPEKTAGNHKLATKVNATGDLLGDQVAAVLVTVQVTIHRRESDPPWAIVTATVRLIYSFSGEAPSKEDVDQFAKVNGVFNAWPFLREIVQSTTLRMGIAPVMLPLHRVRAAPSKGKPELSAAPSGLSAKR